MVRKRIKLMKLFVVTHHKKNMYRGVQMICVLFKCVICVFFEVCVVHCYVCFIWSNYVRNKSCTTFFLFLWTSVCLDLMYGETHLFYTLNVFLNFPFIIFQYNKNDQNSFIKYVALNRIKLLLNIRLTIQIITTV